MGIITTVEAIERSCIARDNVRLIDDQNAHATYYEMARLQCDFGDRILANHYARSAADTSERARRRYCEMTEPESAK